MSFTDIAFGPMNKEFLEAYRKGEIQDKTAWARWKGEDEIYEKVMHLYKDDKDYPVSYSCDHPKDWENYWLHAQFEIYLASREEFVKMIEANGYKFYSKNGLTSDGSLLPPGELYGISYWYW